jgi:hypothetical protein
MAISRLLVWLVEEGKASVYQANKRDWIDTLAHSHLKVVRWLIQEAKA